MEIDSSDFVGDDSLAKKMLGVKNVIIVPEVGMKFANMMEVFELYKKYAYHRFSFRKWNTKTGDGRIVRYMSFTSSTNNWDKVLS